MKKLTTTILGLLVAGTLVTVSAASSDDAVVAAVHKYLPGNTGFGHQIKVKKLRVNDKKRTIEINFNGLAADLPLTKAQVASLKEDCKAVFGPKYAKYKVTLTADGKDFDRLALFSDKKIVTSKESHPFIVKHDAPEASKGLAGRNIALWQSHGWYFEPKLNRWEWQRARIFQTVEDLYTQSYVMPFLMPMLENAGAYVMSPRERDINRTEIVIDNDTKGIGRGSFETSGDWTKGKTEAFGFSGGELHNGDNPFRGGYAMTAKTSGSKKVSATALWNAEIPADNTYAVYVSYTSEPKSSNEAHYRIHAADGTHDINVNQRMGGRTWIYLGHFPLAKGKSTVVELLNDGAKGGIVSADAVKIGGGMGNVARIVKQPLDSINYEYTLSGYPRFTEGARYFLQWAGAPDSVFTPSNYINDYTDDYRSRGLWVNWLAGGSSMLPKQDGLGIPVDMSFAFHTDAGTTRNDSIIGTLGIYSTALGKLGNGTDPATNRDYNDMVMSNIVNDIRAQFEPNWTRRGMWDREYSEARTPQVPAMLLELLSHQNFADMAYGLDPNFRFTVSRAIYKGMLKYLAERDGHSYVVQPLPVHAFAISKSKDSYTLKWEATPDSLEETAMPTYYIVEERIDGGAFKKIATVNKPEYTANITDDKIHSYRIVAGNDGGLAFPSEVLALCNKGGEPVMIVNGFTRISAPDRFDSGEIAGFYDARDHGVPYVRDISFIGSQFEYRRDIPWMDDDAAGFGASRANYEDKVIAGNTFDFVYTHGEAIRNAGRGFISSSVEAFTADSSRYDAVDLILGKQKEIKRGRGVYGTYYKTFPSALQNRIRTLTSNGTDFFISGAYVATDLWDNPFSSKEVAAADQEFAEKVLGYHWRVGQASTTGEAYEVATRYHDFDKGEYRFSNELNEDCYAVESPDSFFPTDNKAGATFMRYRENNLIAGTLYAPGAYKTVVIGFPFETIRDSHSRTHLMRQILQFFNSEK